MSASPEPADPRAAIEATVLAEVTPDDAQVAQMAATCDALVQRLRSELQGSPATAHAEPTIQGSIAKGTWLAGAADVDCFLLFPPDAPADVLKDATLTIGARVLEDGRHKYAQHPYLVGRFHGLDVDLVPAYRLADAAQKMTAVDRTPFHTAWVRAAIERDESIADAVRLAKTWCKGVGVYGAETAIGGFSGYLVEVLTIQAGSFGDFIDGLAAAQPLESTEVAMELADPVDPSRNCAAAVRHDVLRLAAEAAHAYRLAPDRRFFFPVSPSPAPADGLRERLAGAGLMWLGARLPVQTDRLDIVFPQFRRVCALVAEAADRAGFPVARHLTRQAADDEVWMHWLLSAETLPATEIRQGPPVTAAKNAEKFRAKWAGHQDAAGEVVDVDGRLQVEVHVRARTADRWLATNIAGLMQAKHPRAAWQAGGTMHDDLAALIDQVPGEAAAVTDLILDRRPWQR